MKLDSYAAVATLIGTTVGAGILGIPYVVAQSGAAIGLLHITVIGAAIILTNLYLGEIVLRTKDNHQISGYAERYLGKKGKILTVATMIGSIYGALVAYLIGIGNALGAIFSADTFIFSVLFWIIGAIIIHSGLKAVKKSETVMTSGVIAFAGIIIIAAFLSGKFDAANTMTVNPAHAFLPFGVVLFAFLGATAIPQMEEILGKNRKKLQRAIVIGGLIPMALYALFALAVVGVSGGSASEIATVRLGELIGGPMNVVINLFAVFAMGTSFLALGLALKEMYVYDYKVRNSTAWALTTVVPLAAFAMGVHSFIAVIGLAGALSGGLQGILIVMMHRNVAKKGERKPAYALPHNNMLAAALTLLFAAGIVFELLIFSGLLA